jgi:hypothetical protein
MPGVAGDARVAQALQPLGANEAISLGRAEVVGPLNDVARRFGLHRSGPRSRDYTLKMVWSPERQRALFAGANHAVPHRLNDVWEFDLAALRWTLLYAPDNPRSHLGLGDDASDVEFRDGVLQTRRGGPAVIGHGWWGQTYDPLNRQMLFMNTWVTDQDAAIRRVGGNPAQRYRSTPLWAFDPGAARWLPIRTPAPSPPAPFGGMLEFVPELGGAIWHTNGWQSRATWLFDSARQSWRDLHANATTGNFAHQSPRREAVAYHDRKRRLVVAQSGWRTHHFDTVKSSWRRVADAEASPDTAPFAHDARTAAYHDPVSGHGLLIDFKVRRLWAYDPDATRWSLLDPTGSPMPGGKRMLAFVDPVHNVLVVIDDTAVWAYRYRARG